ncbi:MAG: DedA family protein [Streptosporangiales bacterium]|nr:DedA family protein [Streptosporangiales bacterium]MBO0891001.1 DedA family protein [Acidothermales bacterium]
MPIHEWLLAVPPLAVYAILALVIGVESVGVPLPGEVALVTAGLMAAGHVVSPWGVAAGAILGAVVGDSVGYVVGRRGGRPLLERAGRRYPRHLGAANLGRAERAMTRWGVWAVFAGRFVALLRMFAGPLAGALRMPYPVFLVANASGGVVWAGGTTFALYYLGHVVEPWLGRFSWLAVAVTALCGIVSTLVLRRRAVRRRRGEETEEPTAVTAGVSPPDGRETSSVPR